MSIPIDILSQSTDITDMLIHWIWDLTNIWNLLAPIIVYILSYISGILQYKIAQKGWQLLLVCFIWCMRFQVIAQVRSIFGKNWLYPMETFEFCMNRKIREHIWWLINKRCLKAYKKIHASKANWGHGV